MYSAIAANKRNTVIIMAGFISLLTGLSFLWGKSTGDIVSAYYIIIFILAYATVQYFMAGRLAILMSGAKEIAKSDQPQLWNLIENLAITEGLPMPRVFIIDDPAPNAFATGRDPEHALVAVTTGLLEIMDQQELQAVVAHELGHIKNYDIRVSTIAFGLVSAVAVLGDFALRLGSGRSRSRNNAAGILVIFGLAATLIAWIIGPLVTAAVSRQREYLADATGIEMTRYPEGLENALNKLQAFGQPMQQVSKTMAHMYISNPLRPKFFNRVLASHPPLQERIARIQEMKNSF